MSKKRNPIGVVLLAAAFLGGCGAATGLVVVPPAVEKAEAPKGKYKNIHAIFLYDIGYVHYDPIDIGNSYGPDYAFTRFTKIKLLTRAATDTYYGNILFEHYDELYNISAHIEKEDGSRIDLKKGDFITAVLVKNVIPGRTPEIHYYRTTIVFPSLEPGDTIVYKYTKRSPELAWTFNKMDAPVLFSKFMVARPPQHTIIQPVIFDRHDLKIEKTKDKGMATGMQGYVAYSRQATYDIWTARDIPAITHETAMQPISDLASRVLVWQTARKLSWETLAGVYRDWFTHYGRYPDKPKEIAAKLVEGIKEPRERARAIHDWVKKNLNIRSHARLTVVPRQIQIERIDIDELLKEKNATPEKVASLMWLMMQSVGIDATVLLATHADYATVVEEMHSIYQFTHPFLALSDGTLIDTTHRLCPFGMLPWEFENRKGLWIKEGSASFNDIPVRMASTNRRDIKVTAEVEPDGTAKIDSSFSMTGQMALAWRKWLAPQNPRERETAIRSIVTSAAAKGEVDEFELGNLEEVDKPLEIKVRYHVPSYSEVLRDKMIMKVGAFAHHTACPSFTQADGYTMYVCPKPIAENRKSAVMFPFRRYDEMDIEVKFPKGFLLQALPKGFRTRKIESGTSLGVQTSYGSDGGKNLKIKRKFSINEPFVDDQGYPTLRDVIRRYEAQKDALITLDIPK